MGALELTAAFFLLLTVLVPLLWRMLRARPAWVKAAVLLAWLGTYAGVTWIYASRVEPAPPESSVSNRTQRELRDGYVGSETCRSCHPHHHETWHDSYHRTMTQVASRESVLGDFDDVTLMLGTEEFRLGHDNDDFYFEVGDERYEIVMTTGSHHMQVYWYDSGFGRETGQFPFVYLLEEKRWIPRSAAFLQPPTNFRLDEAGRWNAVCIKCHATHGAWMPGSSEGETAHTVVAEFGISCEACHGPGEQHVTLNRNPGRRYKLHLSEGGDETMVQPQHIDSGRSSQVCGQCHSVLDARSSDLHEHWSAHGYRYRPGDDLDNTRFVIRRDQSERPEIIRELIDRQEGYLDDHFWNDGMVRISGREYNGLLESGCHQHGDLSCVSCHQMHQETSDTRSRTTWADDQLSDAGTDDRACTQCHKQFSTDEKIAAHTHHPVGSSGSRCYNCHMPHTTYGLLKAIRSHTIDSPSVSSNLDTGRPNACNLCHLDKTLEWTAGHLADWYQHEEPELASEHKSTAASLNWLLKGDAGQRALIAWHLGWETAQAVSEAGWMAPHLSILLEDPYDAVRFIAYRSLRSLPGVSVADFGSYDFMGDPETQAETIRTVMRNWSEWNRARSGPAWAPQLLIRPDGTPDLNAMHAIYRFRDNRRVLLAE